MRETRLKVPKGANGKFRWYVRDPENRLLAMGPPAGFNSEEEACANYDSLEDRIVSESTLFGLRNDAFQDAKNKLTNIANDLFLARRDLVAERKNTARLKVKFACALVVTSLAAAWFSRWVF